MLNKIFFAIFIAFLSPFLHAKVDRVSFNELVERSDFILYGEVFSVSYNDEYSGEAKLKVFSVIKGEYSNANIIYKWNASPHSRDIDRAAQRYVIFVRNDGGDYVSAVHGAGVWNVYLNIDAYDKSILDVDFVNELPESLFECVRFCDGPEENFKITLNTLFRFFDKRVNVSLDSEKKAELRKTAH